MTHLADERGCVDHQALDAGPLEQVRQGDGNLDWGGLLGGVRHLLCLVLEQRGPCAVQAAVIVRVSQLRPLLKRPRLLGLQCQVNLPAAAHLELPAVAVVDVLDDHGRRGIRVEEVPCQPGTGIVVVQRDVGVALPVVLLLVEELPLAIRAPHLEGRLVVVEPGQTRGIGGQHVHVSQRQAEVQDVDVATLVLQVLQRLGAVVHGYVLCLVPEAFPGCVSRTEPVGAGGVVDDEGFHVSLS